MKIPIVRPWFDEQEEDAVIRVLRSGRLIQGANVQEFERLIAEFVGRNHAVAVSSCTAALQLAVITARIQPGDEVLVPAFTWISTANAVELAGAKPVFCDIELNSYNIDLDDARKRITSTTRAIIPVHLFGLAADMTAVRELSQPSKLVVIEDAACALGSYFENRHVGVFGQSSCFSFHPRKSITTGEGGMILTDDAEDYETLLRLRNIGSDRSGFLADFPILGFNYRMTDLQASIGITQMKKLDQALEMRKACAQRYDTIIKNSPLAEVLQTPVAPANCVHSYQSYVCRIISSGDLHQVSLLRDRWIDSLGKEGIETRPGTHAPCFLSYYRNKYGYQPADYPNAYRAERLSIALPLFPGLTMEEQETVVSRMTDLWNSFARS